MSDERNITNENSKEQVPNSNKEVEGEVSEIGHASQPQTINEKQERENMEIHKHPHHVMHKKKWGEYLLEFFMLFLAVFLGFLAENQREHFAEHQREEQFIKSLVEDVEMDTTQIAGILESRDRRDKTLDSLSMLINLPEAPAFSSSIYYLGAFATRGIALHYIPYDGTMQQLKNAGNLRLIRKKNVRDSIMSFDREVRAVVRQGETEEDMMSAYRDVAQEIFDGRVLDKSRNENNQVLRLNYNPPLRLVPQNTFKLTYRIHGLRNINKANKRDLKALFAKASNLLIVLKKEYQLE